MTTFSVVMLTTDYLDSRHGGVESHIYFLSRELLRRGHDVLVARVSAEPGSNNPPSDVPVVHVPVPAHIRTTKLAGLLLRRPLTTGITTKLVQNLHASSGRQTLRQYVHADSIIHQHDFLGNIRLSRAISRSNPVVWTNHLGEFLLLRRTRLGTALLRRLTHHYQAVMAPSSELADLPWRNDVLRVWNGVDHNHFVPPESRPQAKEKLGLNPSEPVVLIPRRWAPTKGVLIAAQAFTVAKSQPFQTIFVGAGRTLYPAYAASVDRILHKLDPPAMIIDQVPNAEMVQYYQAADVTLIPSFLEATSIAALEAMACGSVVIASAVGGMPELIGDGYEGFLVEPGDPVALAATVSKALACKDLPALAAAGRLKVERDFSWARVADVAEQAYEAAR